MRNVALNEHSAEARIATEWRDRMMAAENEWIRSRQWCDCPRFRDSGQSYGGRRACRACGRLSKSKRRTA